MQSDLLACFKVYEVKFRLAASQVRICGQFLNYLEPRFIILAGGCIFLYQAEKKDFLFLTLAKVLR